MSTTTEQQMWASFSKELGVNIQRFRIKRGLTQEDVASAADLSRLQYQRLEWGRNGTGVGTNPTLKTLLALSQVLNVSLEEIIPGKKLWPDLRAQ